VMEGVEGEVFLESGLGERQLLERGGFSHFSEKGNE
jgi:hypothetical protein